MTRAIQLYKKRSDRSERSDSSTPATLQRSSHPDAASVFARICCNDDEARATFRAAVTAMKPNAYSAVFLDALNLPRLSRLGYAVPSLVKRRRPWTARQAIADLDNDALANLRKTARAIRLRRRLAYRSGSLLCRTAAVQWRDARIFDQSGWDPLREDPRFEHSASIADKMSEILICSKCMNGADGISD